MTHKEKYRQVMLTKEYGEMNYVEKSLCIEMETELLRPYVDKLRQDGVLDHIISAYISDLYEDYLIFDDVAVTDAFGISDDDYERGKDYLWYAEEINPLYDFNKKALKGE